MKLFQVFLPLVIISSLEASQANQQQVNNVGPNFQSVYRRPNTPRLNKQSKKALDDITKQNQQAPKKKNNQDKDQAKLS